MTDNAQSDRYRHLFAALLFAAATIWVARLAADQLLAHLRPAAAPSQQSAPLARPAADDAREAAVARAEQQRREAALIAADRARREAQRDAMLKARDAEIAAARQEEERKQAAWQRFYRKPKKCDAPPDNAALVECSNHYIREKARFEKLYADGKIQAP